MSSFRLLLNFLLSEVKKKILKTKIFKHLYKSSDVQLYQKIKWQVNNKNLTISCKNNRFHTTAFSDQDGELGVTFLQCNILCLYEIPKNNITISSKNLLIDERQTGKFLTA